MAERDRPLGPPPLLQRGHELVGARVAGGDRPFVHRDRPGFLPLQLDLQVLDSSVLDYLLTQQPLLLRVDVRDWDVRVCACGDAASG